MNPIEFYNELEILRLKKLRDQFAMAALQGLVANAKLTIGDVASESPSEILISGMAACAYKFADEMLKERGKK